MILVEFNFHKWEEMYPVMFMWWNDVCVSSLGEPCTQVNCWVVFYILHYSCSSWQFLSWQNIPVCMCVPASGCVCVCRRPTTPKLKTSDLGVISPLSASGAMYARVPTILSVIMVVDVRLADALVSPKSEIFATNFSSNRIFALTRKKTKIMRTVSSEISNISDSLILSARVKAIVLHFGKHAHSLSSLRVRWADWPHCMYLLTSLWTWWLLCRYSKPLAVPSAIKHLCLQDSGGLPS